MTGLVTFLRGLDPKLVSTVLTLAIARGVLALGGDPLDPLWSTVAALVLASVVGYLWPNDGTVLRTPQETGNADPLLLPFEDVELSTPTYEAIPIR